MGEKEGERKEGKKGGSILGESHVFSFTHLSPDCRKKYYCILGINNHNLISLK